MLMMMMMRSSMSLDRDSFRRREARLGVPRMRPSGCRTPLPIWFQGLAQVSIPYSKPHPIPFHPLLPSPFFLVVLIITSSPAPMIPSFRFVKSSQSFYLRSSPSTILIRLAPRSHAPIEISANLILLLVYWTLPLANTPPPPQHWQHLRFVRVRAHRRSLLKS